MLCFSVTIEKKNIIHHQNMHVILYDVSYNSESCFMSSQNQQELGLQNKILKPPSLCLESNCSPKALIFSPPPSPPLTNVSTFITSYYHLLYCRPDPGIRRLGNGLCILTYIKRVHW